MSLRMLYSSKLGISTKLARVNKKNRQHPGYHVFITPSPNKPVMSSSSDYDEDLITQAAFIKRCVPCPDFTNALALWCAGMNHNLTVVPRFGNLVTNCSQALEGEIVIHSDIDNMVNRAKIFVSHAERVPKKINKGMPSTPEEAKASTAIKDYCRLVGFSDDLLTGKCRPKYQQIFSFSQKFRDIKRSCPPLKTTFKSLDCSGKINNKIQNVLIFSFTNQF